MNWDSRADWDDVGVTVWVDDDGSKEGAEDGKEWRSNDGDDVDDKDGSKDGEGTEGIDDGV